MLSRESQIEKESLGEMELPPYKTGNAESANSDENIA
jgi:hypothetical protein